MGQYRLCVVTILHLNLELSEEGYLLNLCPVFSIYDIHKNDIRDDIWKQKWYSRWYFLAETDIYIGKWHVLSGNMEYFPYKVLHFDDLCYIKSLIYII